MSWPSIFTIATPAPLVVLLNPIGSPLSAIRPSGREQGGDRRPGQLVQLGVRRGAGHHARRAEQQRTEQPGAAQGASRPDREVPRRPIRKYENVDPAAKP